MGAGRGRELDSWVMLDRYDTCSQFISQKSVTRPDSMDKPQYHAPVLL